jgi:aspartate racemase
MTSIQGGRPVVVVTLLATSIIGLVLFGLEYGKKQKKQSTLPDDENNDTPSRTTTVSKWKPLEYSVLFGVVGGLGPRATTYFMEIVVTERCKLFVAMRNGKTPQERLGNVLKEFTCNWTLNEVETIWQQTEGRMQLLDQDHVPLLAAQATTVPPRPKYILKESKTDPLPQLYSVANGLVQAGATHLAVICNTAHFFWPQVEDALGSKAVCLDMVQLTLEYVARLVSSTKCNVGVFATRATLRTRMYQRLCQQKFQDKFSLVSPMDIEEERQDQIEKVIFGEFGIKSGYDSPDRNQESRENLRSLLSEALKLKRKFNVSIVILACSELPLVVNDDSLQRWSASLFLDPIDQNELMGLRFVDPGKVLCHQILRSTLLSRSPVSY